MRHESVTEFERHLRGRPPLAASPAAPVLVRHAHAGRYFGGLWFKVFSERGPC